MSYIITFVFILLLVLGTWLVWDQGWICSLPDPEHWTRCH